MSAAVELLRCAGGTLLLPAMPLVDRLDGGHLWVNPPRIVWERHLLSPDELRDWSWLIAAAGRAMLEVLPQLKGGCLNYWEAGNWALNALADPPGHKAPEAFRQVHMHLLGRSVNATHPDWLWGESPRFPAWRDAKTWAAAFAPLTAQECRTIAEAAAGRLRADYRLDAHLLTTR
ncbi:MAG TPA: hypothetical protein VFV17_01450 [Usitatibacteraceae bacterium]|nr:hypothetical protein [Usitatibacteraceae bacterium]